MAGGLGWHALGARGLWFDEALGWVLADTTWTFFTNAITGRFMGSGLYYALLRSWSVFGDSEVAMRSLSVVFVVATLPVLVVLARELFGGFAAAAAGLAWAFDPFALYYAQEARPYAMVMFLAVLASLFFRRAVATGGRGNWMVYVLIVLGLAYTQTLCLLLVAAHLATVPLHSRRPVRQAWLAGLAILLGLLPLARSFIRGATQGFDFIPPLSLRGFLAAIAVVAGGQRWLVALLALVATAIIAALLREGVGPLMRWEFGFLGAWMLVPLLLLGLLSLRIPLFIPRYLAEIAPAVAILVGLVISRQSPVARSLLLVAVAALGLNSARSYYPIRKQDWREATGFIAANVQPGDRLIADPGWALSGTYYYFRALPNSQALADLTSAPRPSHRTWLIRLDGAAAPGATPPSADPGSHLVVRRHYSGLEVDLLKVN